MENFAAKLEFLEIRTLTKQPLMVPCDQLTLELLLKYLQFVCLYLILFGCNIFIYTCQPQFAVI